MSPMSIKIINSTVIAAPDIKYAFVEKEEFSEKELLSQEKEMLGIYLSGHPLSKLKEEIEKQTTISTRDIDAIDNKTNIDEENISEKSDCHYGIGNHDCSCRISEFYRAKYIL